MAKIELKKCPFCGGEAKIKKTHVYLDEARRVGCSVCHMTTAPVLIDHPAYTERSAGELDESTRYTAEQAERIAAKLWNKRISQKGGAKNEKGKKERDIRAGDG